MTEQEMIQEIALRAELTLEAATRAYKAIQSIITQPTANIKDNHVSSLHTAKQSHAFNFALI